MKAKILGVHVINYVKKTTGEEVNAVEIYYGYKRKDVYGVVTAPKPVFISSYSRFYDVLAEHCADYYEGCNCDFEFDGEGKLIDFSYEEHPID